MNYYMNNGSSNAEENNKELNNEIKAVYESLEKRKDGTTRQTISNAILYWKMTLNLKGQLREMNSHVRQTLLRKWTGADVLNHLRIQILTTFFSVWKRDMELPEIRMLESR